MWCLRDTNAAQNRLPPCSASTAGTDSTWKHTLNRKMKNYALETKNQEEFCSACIWVLPESDSSWSAPPQNLPDLGQVVYSQWPFPAIGTPDFIFMFQHEVFPLYNSLSLISLILSCHFRDNVFSFRNNFWFSLCCNKHDEISYKVSFPVGCWIFYSFQLAKFFARETKWKEEMNRKPGGCKCKALT